MPLIPVQSAVPERDTLSLRLDRELHLRLKAYAAFIGSSKDYVIGQALHRVFRQDKEFAAWLAARDGQESRDAERMADQRSPGRDDRL
jgi:predicted transcriptional regulator